MEFQLGATSEPLIKTAVANPAVAFKLGEAALVAAIESMHNGGLMERKNQNRLSRDSMELRS